MLRPDGTETVKVSYSLRKQDVVRLDAKGGKKQTLLSKVWSSRTKKECFGCHFGSSGSLVMWFYYGGGVFQTAPPGDKATTSPFS